MRIYPYLLIAVFSIFISCKDDESARVQANEIASKKNEQIFEKINKAWAFNVPQPSQNLQNRIQNWSEWRLFLTELNQKPKSSIGAFKQKAKTLSLKVRDLQNNIPSSFNKPEIISRIMTLTTKVNSLDLFINLSYVQDDKIVKLIPEINEEIASLQSQMEEIIKKSEIRLEEGEAEMLRSIPRDSVVKPKAPINLQQQKPSNSRGNSGIVPTLDPKLHR